MKTYKNRNYEIELTLPCPQTQKINVGMWIRRTIGKGKLNVGINALPIRTFRVRHGNGYGGTKAGEIIQDQYNYTVSDPNADHVGNENKTDFAAAILAWQNLSIENKKKWNTRATNARLTMSGYNLFIREYRLNLI